MQSYSLNAKGNLDGPIPCPYLLMNHPVNEDQLQQAFLADRCSGVSVVFHLRRLPSESSPRAMAYSAGPARHPP